MSFTGSRRGRVFQILGGRQGRADPERGRGDPAEAKDVEALVLSALGGADSDDRGRPLDDRPDERRRRAGSFSAGDASAESVTINGTAAADVFAAAGVGRKHPGHGRLSSRWLIAGSEAANDRLGLAGSAGTTRSGRRARSAHAADAGRGRRQRHDERRERRGHAHRRKRERHGRRERRATTPLSSGDGQRTFVWDPGDGSDIVEGQDGVDTLLFNGSVGSEIFAASSNGGRLLFTRNVGNIVMDTDDVEVLS